MKPLLPMHLALDDAGRPRATWNGSGRAPGDARILAEFLESDLALDTVYAERILQKCRRFEEGVRRSWKTTGNAFALALGPEETHISRLFPIDDPQPDGCTLPTAEFQKLVARWAALTSEPAGD
jgi:hypothetical protein